MNQRISTFSSADPHPVEIGPGTEGDLPAIVAILNYTIAHSHATFTSEPATVAERRAWFERFSPTGPHQLLVARDGKQVLGYAASQPYRDHEGFHETVEVSIALDVSSRGQGIGTALYRTLFERLATEPVHAALAGIVLPNDASVGLHRKFGFTEVGTFHEYGIKNGRYLSSLWMERLLHLGSASPGESQAPGGSTRRTGSEQDLVARIREARHRLAAVGPPRVRSADDFERVSLPASDCDVLRDVLLAEKPRTVIEIGLAYGSSALAIAEALVAAGSDEARHVIVDAYQKHFNGSGWAAITEAGLAGLCSLMEERSQIALPRLLGDGFVADAAFVDGSHIFHNVFVDLFYLRELVRPGGLIILDDCNHLSVATAVRYFEVNTGWEPKPLTSPTRLRAFRLPQSRTEPNFNSFRPFGLDATG